jgi:tryptophan synthase beta chain
MGKDQTIVVNLSGRGDKDVFTVAKHLGMDI